MDLFIWAEKKGFVCDPYDDETWLETCRIAAENGHLTALQWLYDSCGYENIILDECCYLAAYGGHVEVIFWLQSIGCDFDEDIISYAAQGNRLDLVEFLFNITGSLPEADYECCATAARHGNLAMLQPLRSHGCEWDDEVTIFAAWFGLIKVIEWAHSNGYPWSEITFQPAAVIGQLDTLKWLRTKNCPWDEDTTKYAASVEMYKWAVANGCPVRKGNPRERLPNPFLCEHI